MKKVLIFTYSTEQGGSELNAFKILKLSSQTNFDWTVLNSSTSDLTSKIKKCENLKNYFSLDFSGVKSSKILNSIVALINIFKNGNYQTVYAVGFIPALLVSLLKPFFCFRFISTRRERMPWAKYYHMPFINFINFMSDYIETNSKTIEVELQNYIFTKGKVYFLPNIILKSSNTKHKIFQKNKKYIGNVANVREAKNIDLFLSLALKMIKKSEDIIFILAGKDNSKGKVKNFIKNNKLIDRLIILEDLNYSEVFSIYLGLDIFLFTSRYEGSPNVLCEAMSENLPIVASRIFATEELIENGKTGYLCDLENEDEFIKKLNLLLNDKIKYNYIRKNLKLFFDKSNLLDVAVEVIYNKIIWNVEGRKFNG